LLPAARKGPEQRAFLLSYGICVVVGGLAQYYALAVFGDPQSTPDAVSTFLAAISPALPWTTFSDMSPTFNSRVAVLIWQQVYKLTWLLGRECWLRAAVLFNALVMGLPAGITVVTARELFGDGLWRLGGVGTVRALRPV